MIEIATNTGRELKWTSIIDESSFDELFEEAATIRKGVLPEGAIALRKTFGLNEPGCAVNCRYCTLGSQYVGVHNKGKIRRGLQREIENQLTNLPPETQVEFVGYWHGVNLRDDSAAELIGHVQSVAASHLVGGDLGIISDVSLLEALRSAGLTYIHNHLETVKRLYPEEIGISANRLTRKIETLRLAHNVKLQTTSGILIGLGEKPEDMAALAKILRNMPLSRVTVNFMDYQTNPQIGERYYNVREQLTPSYALQVLTYLRHALRPDQALMVGSGVGRYLYGEMLPRALRIVDTIHLGSFINLSDQNKGSEMLQNLDALGYRVTRVPYFDTIYPC